MQELCKGTTTYIAGCVGQMVEAWLRSLNTPAESDDVLLLPTSDRFQRVCCNVILQSAELNVN